MEVFVRLGQVSAPRHRGRLHCQVFQKRHTKALIEWNSTFLAACDTGYWEGSELCDVIYRVLCGALYHATHFTKLSPVELGHRSSYPVYSKGYIKECEWICSKNSRHFTPLYSLKGRASHRLTTRKYLSNRPTRSNLSHKAFDSGQSRFSSPPGLCMIPRITPNPNIPVPRAIAYRGMIAAQTGFINRSSWSASRCSFRRTARRLSSAVAATTDRPTRRRLTQEMTSLSPGDAEAQTTIDSVESSSKLQFDPVDDMRLVNDCVAVAMWLSRAPTRLQLPSPKTDRAC